MVPAESEMVSAAPPIPVDSVDSGSPLDDQEIEELIAGELEEVEFFVEQDLLDEAVSILDELAKSHPDHAGIQARLRELKSGEQAP